MNSQLNDSAKKNLVLYAFATFLIFMVALSRLVPHPMNFTPVLAMGLFAGGNFKNKFAILIPILAMLLSDLFIGLSLVSWSVYLSLALIYFGAYFFKTNADASFKKSAIGVVGASLFFFVLTNFAVWMASGIYSLDFSGLVACYVAAIPFLQNTLLGTAFYLSLMVLAYKVVRSWAERFVQEKG